MLHKIKIEFITLIFLSGLSLMFLVNTLPYTRNFPFTQDEILNELGTKLLLQQGDLWHKDNEAIRLQTEFPHLNFILTSLVIKDMQSVPKGFPGMFFIGYTLGSINFPFIYYTNIFFGLLGILYFYKLLELITNSRFYSLFGTLLLSVSPIYLTFSVLLFNNIASVFFFIAATYYYLKYTNIQRIQELILSSFFFSIAIFIRFDFLVYLFLIVFPFSVTKTLKFKTSAFQDLIKATAPIIIAVLLSLCFYSLHNYKYFGSLSPIAGYTTYVVTSSQAVTNEASNSFMTKINRFFTFDPQRLLNNFSTKYLSTSGYFFIFFILAVFSIIKAKMNKNFILQGVALMITISLLFYNSGIYYGINSDQILLRSSYSRYFLIPHIFIIIFFILFFQHFRNKFSKRQVLFNLTILTLVSILQLYSLDGPRFVKSWTLTYQEYKDTILANTEENSIVVGDHIDTKLFGYRDFISIYKDPELNNLKDEELLEVIAQLTANNVPIYITFDDNSMVDKIDMLGLHGYSALQVKQIKGFATYKLTQSTN